MASSENLQTIETPTFLSSFADSWISGTFSRDTQALTTAPQNSISDNSLVNSEPATRRHRIADMPLSGKVSKRKPRASKRTQTTFIAADPANFRQMVQQVTGVGFGGGHVSVSPILKPEPQRPGSRLFNGIGPGSLPTLDTSALLLDQHQPFSGTYSSFPTVESWNV